MGGVLIAAGALIATFGIFYIALVIVRRRASLRLTDANLEEDMATDKQLKGGREVDEIRSCERCKYGANIVACHMGRTGNLTFIESLPESLEVNPFRPDPARDSTRAFLLNHNQMPCFEPLDK